MSEAVSTNGHGPGLALVEAPQTARLWVCSVTLRASSTPGLGCLLLGRLPKKGHESCGWWQAEEDAA